MRVTCVNLHGDNHITHSAVPSPYGQPTYFRRLTSTRVGFEGVYVCQTTGHFKHFGDVGFVPQATRVPVRMVLNRKHNTLFPSLFLSPPTNHGCSQILMNEEYRGKYICKKQVFPPVIKLKHTFYYFQSDENYHTSLRD